jgi:N-acetyl-anhydromuramyl-L-alanine amidase AmpD
MNISIAPCHKVYRVTDSRVRPVELAVAHWTASPPKAPGKADPDRIRAWLADEEREQSTHLIILRDGDVIQGARFNERTWHAGGSRWTDPSGVTAGGVNYRSIGIDLENVGFLKKSPKGDGSFIDGYGGRYKGATPKKTGRGYFEPYTPAQLVTLDEVVRWVALEVAVLRDPRRWVGHESIQPGKSDPGPLFPWSAVQAAVASVGH